MLRRGYLVCMTMSYVAASVSTTLFTEPSSEQPRLPTAVLSPSSTDHVGESTSQGFGDTFNWLDVPLHATDISIKTELQADKVSNTEQIRPTSSSEYLKSIGTNLEASVLRSNNGGMDTLTEEIADTSTYSEREKFPSSLTEYSVTEGSKDDQASIDRNVFWSNPNDVSHMTSVNMVAASTASHVENYLVLGDSFSVTNAFEEITVSDFDDGDIELSAFEFIDSFSAFQDDHSYWSDATEWEVDILSDFDGSDVIASDYKSIDSLYTHSIDHSDVNDLEVATPPAFDDESDDFYPTRTSDKTRFSASATIGFGSYASISHSKTDSVSLPHSQSDSASLSHSQSDSASLSHSQSDSASLSHSQSEGASLSHSQSDSASLSQSQSDSASLSHSQSDSVSLSHSQSDPVSISHYQSDSNSSSVNATSTLGNTTSADNSPTPSTVTETRMCRCDCHYAANLKLYRNATAVNITSDEVQKELKKQVTNLQKELTLNKTNLSSAKRKKTSMNDDRASARGVGIIGVAMLVLLMGGLVLMDLTTIKRDFQRLRDNLGHCCQEENKSAC